MTLLCPTGEIRLAEYTGELKDQACAVRSNGYPFVIQQAWIDQTSGKKIWKNVPQVWMGDPDWNDGTN